MKRTVVAGLLVLAIVLLGCSAATEVTPTPEALEDFVPVVSVTGKVVPAVWGSVSAQAGGTVVEAPVESGDEVAAGAVLLRLDDSDARLAVQRAEATVAEAQAELARLQAPARPEEIASVEAQLAGMRAALSQVVAQRDELKNGGTEAAVAAAQAQVAAAEADAWSAKDVYDRLGWQLGDAATTQWHAAQAELDAAQKQLAHTRSSGEAQERAADAAVWAASAQRDATQAQLDLLKASATAEDIAVAEAAVQQAQAALEEVRVALTRTEIHAPFAGTVGLVQVRRGEFVAPGQPVVTLGDLTTLRVETTDLDEVDVAQVAVGQDVTLTFDALSVRTFTGHVTRIAPMADPGVGGVNYTVVIEPDALDAAIRWGMTAFVDIKVKQ
ncbi:MAG: efflux RND transporter periplasmic adaptor subunit [Chloroflexota bacterium]|nr:efflux RND transporter periplasmic adaptor subunit [Chloroflexota bacterium]